ncbi:MAG: DUF4301 family protein [Flavobacteriaceae bacterium]|nr:DUF4301 family protein [Flavobacteriaceae bacterium]
MNFSESDRKQIEEKGLTIEEVNKQIDLFKQGLPFINLMKPATINSGIEQFSKVQKEAYISHFQGKRDEISMVKFVPASGAATRMFKFLFQFLEAYSPEKESINSYINRHKASGLSIFLAGLEKFPFYDEVIEQMKASIPEFDKLSVNEKQLAFLNYMFHDKKFNFSNYPKGLFPFHKYKDHIATAFEEHLFEAGLYASSNGKADLHFTISEKHNHKFDEEFKRIEEIVERKTKTAFNIEFSFQKESTDTIAVNSKNEPFRNPDGSLLFRPSGHGALLENLNEIKADIIFIKNIDNVVVFEYEEIVAEHKMMLAGYLLSLQERSFENLAILDTQNIDQKTIYKIADFLTEELNLILNPEFEKFSTKYQIDYLREKLNRPIRVCGMVKNEGEPGGGPFWVKDESGTISLQIVESAQVDKKNKHQKNILKNATHFNPVDLVCGVKNYKGEPFDLKQYVDKKTAFISMKTKTGKNLKALELPGLWNGSMANWNTIFVEVPLITFNPVKTVNDLLKATHQIS